MNYVEESDEITNYFYVLIKVLEMESCLQEANNAIPPREVMSALAEKFRYMPDTILPNPFFSLSST